MKKKPPKDTESLRVVTVNPSLMHEISEMEKKLLDPEDIRALQGGQDDEGLDGEDVHMVTEQCDQMDKTSESVDLNNDTENVNHTDSYIS